MRNEEKYLKSPKNKLYNQYILKFAKINKREMTIKKSRPTKAATRLWGGRFYGAIALDIIMYRHFLF